MAKQYDKLDSKLRTFIENQMMFFVATAPKDGKINLSPKGLDTFRIMDDDRVIWLNLTGSGNETAAHLLENSRITIMFCAFDGNPLILRLYCQGSFYQRGDKEWDSLISHFPEHGGARQIIDLKIEMVQTSCGFAVPLYEFQGHRDILDKWTADKGEEGIKEYWKEKNTVSLDGNETGMG